MNITENGRAITTVTVTRTHSLRETPRQISRDEQCPIDNGLVKNQRSLSNDKISTDGRTPFFTHQRGSSLRQNGKTAFPISSPISNNHHSFQIIKPIETSPRTSESAIDPEFGKISQKFKFKPRSNNSAQGGPLIPDHSLKMDSQRDNKFTPRPPLSKRFSDQDDANSDIDSNQSVKNPRSYSMQNTKVPVSKPFISPTKPISQNLRGDDINCQASIEKTEKNVENHDEYVNGLEDNIHSDCEVPQLTQFGVSRSSLRKGSDSPNNSDTPVRNSPSPTKTVKWNPNLSVKNIPNRSKPSKSKPKPKTNHNKEERDSCNKIIENEMQSTFHINLEFVESHETYIQQCTSMIRGQISLLESFRKEKISLNSYQKDLIEQIECQQKLISSFHTLLTTGVTNCDKASQNSEF